MKLSATLKTGLVDAFIITTGLIAAVAVSHYNATITAPEREIILALDEQTCVSIPEADLVDSLEDYPRRSGDVN